MLLLLLLLLVLLLLLLLLLFRIRNHTLKQGHKRERKELQQHTTATS
jgi:hypothetical protein